MTLEILICTTVERLHRVAQLLLPPMKEVSYMVSCQGGEPQEDENAPFGREDVVLLTMPERGLSKNRNKTFLSSTGDLLLLCDDDEVLNEETVRGIISDFEQHPEWDIIQYEAEGLGKHYPSEYVSSVELALRRWVADSVRFNERFGLGSPELASGEEEVFLHDARGAGATLGYLPKVVCRVEGESTGKRFLADGRVQRSKGAVFCYTRGKCYAYYKCTREAMGWMLRKRVNPLPLLRNMYWGIRYVKA